MQRLILTVLLVGCVSCDSAANAPDAAAAPAASPTTTALPGTSLAAGRGSIPAPVAPAAVSGTQPASLPTAGSPAAAPPVASTGNPAAPAAMSSTPPPAAAPTTTPPAAPQPTAAADWQPLLEGDWELAAGEEGYRCARLTVTEDMYLKEFQPIAPPGTHHTLLSVNESPTAPDGIAVCSSADVGHVTLLGSGVGENYSAGPLPDGVAYKIAKGSQLNLNLHLFNVNDTTLTGVSGVRVRKTTVDKVTQFAETILAGTLSLSIPRGMSTATGQCTIKSDTTVFAVSPHMHQLGVHLKAVVSRAGGKGDPVSLYDGPYDFYEQRQYPAHELALKAGDKLQVDCTFDNTTDRTITFGESSKDEMCFLGVYRFPVAGEGLICAN